MVIEGVRGWGAVLFPELFPQQQQTESLRNGPSLPPKPLESCHLHTTMPSDAATNGHANGNGAAANGHGAHTSEELIHLEHEHSG